MKLVKIVMVVTVVLTLISCGKVNHGSVDAAIDGEANGSDINANDESTVLASSTFYPGEYAASVRARMARSDGESGYIKPGKPNAGGNDHGTIPSSGTSGSGSGTSGSGSSSSQSGSQSTSTSSSSGSEGSSTDSGGTGSSSSPSGTTNQSGSGSTQTGQSGGSDGGYIPSSSSGGGNDTGSVSGSSGGVSSSSSGGVSGSSSSGGVSGSSSGGSSTSNSGGSVAGSSGATSGQSGQGTQQGNAGTTGQTNSGTQSAGNDSGYIPPSSSSSGGNDSGSIPGSSGSSSGGSSGGSSSGGPVAGGSSSSGGTSGGGTSGSSSGGGTSGSSSGGLSGSSGSSGGSSSSGSSSGGNDTGNKPGVIASPNPDGGQKPVVSPWNQVIEKIKEIIEKLAPPIKPVVTLPPVVKPNAKPVPPIQTIDKPMPPVAVKPPKNSPKPKPVVPNDPLESLDIKIARVCSVRRSQSDKLFFEEAHNPIISIDALYMPSSGHGCMSECSYASMALGAPVSSTGFESEDPSRIILRSVSLASVDLLAARYTTSVSLAIDRVKEAFGKQWRDAMVSVFVCDDTNQDGACFDEAAKHKLSVNPVTFSADHIPSVAKLEVWSGRDLTKAYDPEYCETQYSPIVLDLTGGGILLGDAEKGVRFDLNDTGSAITTAWVTSSTNALLARDIDGNGRIDSGAELFGSATRLSNGQRAANGFEALKQYDQNNDNILNANDSGCRVLRLWIDENRNGYTERGELVSLRSMNIESINLAYINMNEVDAYGNQTRQRSTYRRVVNGKSTPFLMVDVWFNTLVAK